MSNRLPTELYPIICRRTFWNILRDQKPQTRLEALRLTRHRRCPGIVPQTMAEIATFLRERAEAISGYLSPEVPGPPQWLYGRGPDGPIAVDCTGCPRIWDGDGFRECIHCTQFREELERLQHLPGWEEWVKAMRSGAGDWLVFADWLDETTRFADLSAGARWYAQNDPVEIALRYAEKRNAQIRSEKEPNRMRYFLDLPAQPAG